MKWLITGPNASHHARMLFLNTSCSLWKLSTDMWIAEGEKLDQFLHGKGVRIIVWPQNVSVDVPQWSPKGESAYYNGVLAGHFGTVREVTDDGIMTMQTNTLVVKCERFKWFWIAGEGYNYWAFLHPLSVESRD